MIFGQSERWIVARVLGDISHNRIAWRWITAFRHNSQQTLRPRTDTLSWGTANVSLGGRVNCSRLTSSSVNVRCDNPPTPDHHCDGFIEVFNISLVEFTRRRSILIFTRPNRRNSLSRRVSWLIFCHGLTFKPSPDLGSRPLGFTRPRFGFSQSRLGPPRFAVRISTFRQF